MRMHTSRVVDDAGNTQIVVRQPLREAAQAFLAAHERPVTTLGEPSHQFTVDGAACVYFTLGNMQNPDADAISAAKRKGQSGGKWTGHNAGHASVYRARHFGSKRIGHHQGWAYHGKQGRG